MRVCQKKMRAVAIVDMMREATNNRTLLLQARFDCRVTSDQSTHIRLHVRTVQTVQRARGQHDSAEFQFLAWPNKSLTDGGIRFVFDVW